MPEVPFDVDDVCERLQRRHHGGQVSSIVVISEGAVPSRATTLTRHGSPPRALRSISSAMLAWVGSAPGSPRRSSDARASSAGHDSGPHPSGGTAFDRVLATRFGVAAVGAVHDGAFGMMVALRAGQIVRIPIADTVAQSKTVDLDLYHDVAGVFLG